MRILLLGDQPIPRLSLDTIAWEDGAVRRPLQESIDDLLAFIDAHEQWIIEGCYGELMAAALPFCSELRFLNPGVEACVAHCLQRPWEPEKFPTEAEQQAMLENLVEWVRQYESRTDDYGLACYRKLFTAFTGVKREYRSVAEYELPAEESDRDPAGAGKESPHSSEP